MSKKYAEKYTKRPVRSRPGLTQEQALRSLQEHPEFKPGTKITEFKRQGSRYSAILWEPKLAEFPPKKDEDEDDGGPLEEVVESELEEDSSDDSDDSDDDDGDSDNGDSDSSPFGGPDDKGPDKKEDGDEDGPGEIGEVLALLHKIVDALGLDKPEEAGLQGGPDEGPPPPPGPAPKGPPPGAGGKPAGPPGGGAGGARPGAGRPPLKPGQTPPGGTPIGAPAFASVQEMAKHIPSFTASTDEPLSVGEAKEDLEATYDPYKVKQIRRDKQGKLHALLSVR